MEPRIEPVDDGTGFVIVDPIHRRRFRVITDGPVDPEPTDPEGFYFPTTAAATVTASRMEVSELITLDVRRATGEQVGDVTQGDVERFPPDDYVVELNGTVKAFLRFEGGFTARAPAGGRVLDLDEELAVRVGARSLHERPSATVTTTGAPADVMTAVSTLGSALKTTSCERSWPTLRGYPPEIALGDRLDVPEGLDPPDTDVAIEVPRDLGAVFAVSPLAYYLGATVRPGDRPRVVADGFRHRLDRAGDVADGVERVLKQVLTMDCVVRTEGYYDIDLHQRSLLADRLDLDLAALYGAPLSEQLDAYLSVPFEEVADAVPLWRLSVDVREEPAVVPFVPHLAYDLALVRPRDPGPGDATEAEAALDDHIAEFLRGPVATDGGAAADEEYVTPTESDAIERAWAGRGVPFGAGKLLLAGYRNRLEWVSDGTASVTVVCNDPEMSAEYDDGRLYGDHEEVPFDVRTHRELSVEALRSVLAAETDFLHYIGHAEDGALVCEDGILDPADVDSVGAGAFLLNGCRSYEPGVAMVEAGSVGGVVTISDVGNTGAIGVGRLVARLLNVGFSLRAALSVARERQVVGHQYVVVGAGGAQIVQTESFSPLLSRVEAVEGDRYRLLVESHPTVETRLGSVSIPYVPSNDQYFLTGYAQTFEISWEELVEWLGVGHTRKPVVYEDELYWGPELPLG